MNCFQIGWNALIISRFIFRNHLPTINILSFLSACSNPYAQMGIHCKLRLNDKDLETKSVSAGDTHITFTAKLTKGSHRLAPTFILENGKEVGAYFAIVTKKN